MTTGTISGVLVFFLTNWIMKKKGREDYFRHVMIANQSIITSLKPYIVERGLPEVEIFSSLVASTARNFSVEIKDMFPVSVFCEELIREIISDVYVSTDKKKEYTDSLIEYKKNIDMVNSQYRLDVEKNTVGYSERFRKRITMYMSFLISIMTMMLTVVLTISDITDISEYHNFWYPFESNPMLWLPIMVVLLMTTVTLTWLMGDYTVKKLINIREKKELIVLQDIEKEHIEFVNDTEERDTKHIEEY